MNLLLLQLGIWNLSVLRGIYTIGLKKSFDISRIQDQQRANTWNS